MTRPMDFVDVTNEKPGPKRGRPASTKTEEQKRAEKKERDRRYRESKRAEKVGTPSPEPSPNDPAQLTLDGEIANLRDQYKAAAPPVEVKPDAPVEGGPPKESFVTGYMLLIVCDALIPPLISWYFARFKRKDVDPDKMHMTEREKESLEKVADAAAQDIMGHMSPVTAFALSVGAIYFAKASSQAK